MTDYLTKARLFYGNLEPARQTQLWLGLIAAIVTVVGLSWWMSTEPYISVPSGDLEDTTAIAAALNDADIPIRTNGYEISVPQSRHGEALGVINSVNPQPHSGDVNSFPPGTPTSTQKWGIMRQKEGELAQAIAAMPGVRGARVKISPGKPPMYSDEQGEPARASVFLRVSPTAQLGSNQASAIQVMVAGSVERLRPDHVAVTDSNANIYADGQGNQSDSGNLSSELVEMSRRYKRDIEASVSQAIGRFMPYDDGFTVAAMVDVETESSVEQARDYDDGRAFVIDSQLQEKKREKTAAEAAGGAPGVDAELPERAEPGGAEGGMNKEESTNIRDKLVAPTTDRRTVRPAGKVVRASLALSLNETALAESWGIEPGGEGWDDRIAEIEGIAKTAMGFNETRGDTFVLAAMPFAPIEVEVAPAVTVDGAVGMVAPFVPYAIAFVALLLAFFFIVRPLMARVTQDAPANTTEMTMEIGPDGVARAVPVNREDDDLARRMHELVENFQPVDSDDLNKLVQQQSDASTKVVRDWMKQGA